MQAYPGNDGIVISFTEEECRQMVELHDHIYAPSERGGVPIMLGIEPEHPYLTMIAALKEEVNV